MAEPSPSGPHVSAFVAASGASALSAAAGSLTGALSPSAAGAPAPAAPASGAALDVETASLGRACIAEFLRSTRAYDILPESSKVRGQARRAILIFR
jgi:hypothetical protein